MLLALRMDLRTTGGRLRASMLRARGSRVSSASTIVAMWWASSSIRPGVRTALSPRCRSEAPAGRHHSFTEGRSHDFHLQPAHAVPPSDVRRSRRLPDDATRGADAYDW